MDPRFIGGYDIRVLNGGLKTLILLPYLNLPNWGFEEVFKISWTKMPISILWNYYCYSSPPITTTHRYCPRVIGQSSLPMIHQHHSLRSSLVTGKPLVPSDPTPLAYDITTDDEPTIGGQWFATTRLQQLPPSTELVVSERVFWKYYNIILPYIIFKLNTTHFDNLLYYLCHNRAWFKTFFFFTYLTIAHFSILPFLGIWYVGKFILEEKNCPFS